MLLALLLPVQLSSQESLHLEDRLVLVDAELLEGCAVAAHELDEMDADQAAQVAAHCFATLFDHKVDQSSGAEADPDEGFWSGSVLGFGFEISRDDLGDLVIDFLDAAG